MFIIRSPLLVLLMLLLCTQACFGNSLDDQWKPWLVVVTPKRYPRYLDYPGSKVRPIVMIEITFAQPDTDDLYSYEDLLYVREQAVGCRRWNHLDITPGTAGIVQVQKVERDQFYAVTNALERVCLDLCLGKCMTKYIKVPLESFDGIVNELSRSGFHDPSQGGHISFRLVSEPAGKTLTLTM